MNEQTQEIESSINLPRDIATVPATISPQAGNGSCSCGGRINTSTPSAYVYTLGRVRWRFRNPSAEKEFAQAIGRSETTGLSDQQAFCEILSQRQNRYLARQLCWVLTVEGLETYILMPRDLADLDLLIEAVRPTPSLMDMDVVVGMRGSLSPPELCNGLILPVVMFEQIYSCDRSTLLQSIPRPEDMAEERFRTVSEEVFDRIMQIADNAGATDEHRALNYLAVRYPAIYATVAEAHRRNSSLTAVEARPSRLSSTRKIVDVIFSFVNRNTDVTEKYFVRVDVTEVFPFLVTKMSPYYDR